MSESSGRISLIHKVVETLIETSPFTQREMPDVKRHVPSPFTHVLHQRPGLAGNAYPSKSTYRNLALALALVVMVDADVLSVAHRKSQLSDEMRRAGQRPRTQNEKILVFVPKKNLETWFRFIDGNSADENVDYKRTYGKGTKPGDYAKRLADLCRQQLIAKPPPSLQDARAEWQRLL